jgi:trimethylamine--corrinoid protein Co-methyltransferase
MIRTPAAFLMDGEVRRVHEASLEILEDVGLLVRNVRARAIFAHHGCKVEAGGERVRFPRAVVEQHRTGIPGT